MVLIPGHVVLFQIANTRHGHHHFSNSLNLTDAYVFTGLLGACHFPELFDFNPAPRRYQDGLETDDPDFTTTFIIR
jgi:hypothetical protein